MADYDLPSVVEKRVRYFDGQFLQDQDFIDEQDYQMDREHRHNRLLHGPGIAEGLTVTSATANQVTVAAGTAIDSDGYQLVLAQATAVDLPAADFNDKQGIGLYISYLQTAVDVQTVGGSGDYTRWLERPEITPLPAGAAWSGTSPPVLLATLALDGSGRVAIDNTVRSYSGLLLPGSGADAAVFHATSGGPVELAGSLTVDGQVGIGTIQPAANLHVNVASSATPVNALQIDVQSFQTGSNSAQSQFMLVRDVGAGSSGNYFCVRGDGNVGIGTASPENAENWAKVVDVLSTAAAKLSVRTPGIDARVMAHDGGWWGSLPGMVIGTRTGHALSFGTGAATRMTITSAGNVGIGITSPVYPLHLAAGKALRIEGGASPSDPAAYFSLGGAGAFSIDAPGRPSGRFVVLNSGNVGVGTANPGAKLEVAGSGGTSVDLVVNGRMRSNNNDGGLWVGSDRFVGGFDTNKIGFWNGGAWQLAVLPNGNVGVGITSPAYPLHLAAGKALRIEGGVGPADPAAYFSLGGAGAFSIDAPGVPSGRFVVQSLGNVGVGTANPRAKLHVNVAASAAPINALQVDVQSFGTPDNAKGSFFLALRDIGGGTTPFCVRGDGSVGLGTTDTFNQRLCVVGPTWLKGDLFVNGRLLYWWNPDGAWKVINNRAGDWAGSNSDSGPNTSDARLKANLRPISNALRLVRKLQGMRYRWGDSGLRYFTRDIDSSVFAGPDATDEQNREIREEERRKALEALAGERLGLVAQDVEMVLPELVHEDGDGYKHIRYQHLTALLTEAIKEQDAVVQALSAKVAALQAGPSGQAAKEGRSAPTAG